MSKEGRFLQCLPGYTKAATVEAPSLTSATTGLLDISEGLKKAFIKISLNGIDVLALIGSESTNYFIYPRVVKMCSLKSTNCCKTIMMAAMITIEKYLFCSNILKRKFNS